MDRRDQPINDFVSLRFNSLLQRYELTAMVWDINNQRFVPANPEMVGTEAELLREYHFYVTASVESTTVDLRAGDDTFRGDAGYVFVGDTGTEWGIGEGAVQSGGGDVDGDGFDDLVVSGADGNVFIVFGQEYGQVVLSVDENQTAAGRWLQISGFAGAAEARIVGNVTGDNKADLMVSDITVSRLFVGKDRADWFDTTSLLPGGQPVFDFNGTTHGFTLNDDNDQSKSVWENEAGRLVMGGAQTYANSTTVFGFQFPIPVQAKTTSPLIDLRNAVDPILSFDHWLLTENNPGRDIARV